MAQSQISFVPEQVVIDVSSKHHHGLGFWPPPSSDPKDPLRWPRWVKILALLSMALFNFVANFAGAGLSVATVLLEAQFQKTQQQVNALLTVGRGWISVCQKVLMIRSTAVQFPPPRCRKHGVGAIVSEVWQTAHHDHLDGHGVCSSCLDSQGQDFRPTSCRTMHFRIRLGSGGGKFAELDKIPVLATSLTHKWYFVFRASSLG